jgi:hypothetical protein
MIIAAVFSIAGLFSTPAPVATCHAGPVSYKFVGAAGTTFTYSGRQYAVQTGGAIELIGHGGDVVYQVEGRMLPLDVWPTDDFGTRTVPLPARQTDPLKLNVTN